LFFRINWEIICAMAYQSLITASFGFVAWNTLLQKYGATTLNSFFFIVPISGVLFGGLILGEPITSKIWLALFLIVSGILVVHVRPERHLPLFYFGNRL
jgi:drug/metabolite transporter (DMT)-like permease